MKEVFLKGEIKVLGMQIIIQKNALKLRLVTRLKFIY